MSQKLPVRVEKLKKKTIIKKVMKVFFLEVDVQLTATGLEPTTT